MVDAKLFARVGAVAFVAIALTMTALDLRGERRAPLPEIVELPAGEGDPLAATLKDCAALGEQAAETATCRGAWAEKRRRFLGVSHHGEPSATASEVPPPTVMTTEFGVR